MSLMRINRQAFIVKNVLKSQRLYSSTSLPSSISIEDEYTETPQYPQILDTSYEAVLERKKCEYHEQIKAVKTVQEKQIKLNMPKYYGFKCYMMLEDRIPYDNLHLVQHITRTHLIEQPNLPEFYSNVDTGDLVNIQNEIKEAVLFEYDGYSKMYEIKEEDIDPVEKENITSRAICKQINRSLVNNLAQNCPHLKDLQVDFDTRLESSWFAGGMNPPENIKRYRRAVELRKKTENDPTDRAIQYIGNPNLTLRSRIPLAPVVPYSEAENMALEVPYFQMDPRTVGTYTEHRRLVNTPGFWPGDPHEFGILSYHKRGHFLKRQHYNDPQEHKEALHCQGILASFGWLNAQANYLGFTTFNEITYPIVTQTVITNGQTWSFYVYQLNTLLMHSKNPKENPRRNICWATPELKLYEEIKDGQIIGFNDNVLKFIAQFYANEPKERLGIELRPYLGEKEKLIADYEDADKRQWLEREYKFIVSNRPRFKLPYEIYHWEKIYKIDHKLRPMEARRRPFELFKKPWDRTLDDRLAFYIPRKLRPDLKRNKGRYAKEYFP